MGGQGVAAGSAPSDNEDCQSARGTRANRRTPASQPCTGSQAAVPSVRCVHIAYLHFLILVSHFRLGKYFSFPKFRFKKNIVDTGWCNLAIAESGAMFFLSISRRSMSLKKT